MPAKGQIIPTEERFHKKYKIVEGGCWEWQFAKDKDGYGRFYLGIGEDKKKICLPASRYSYIIHHGPLESHLQACHTCDNPSCVNPNHLFAGTCKQNLHDAMEKGRKRSAPHPSVNTYRRGCRCKNCIKANSDYYYLNHKKIRDAQNKKRAEARKSLEFHD